MGYRDRGRFLDPEHRTKLFDRAGNAVLTVWVNGRLVGAWGQRKEDGCVVYGLFEPVRRRRHCLRKSGDNWKRSWRVSAFRRAFAHLSLAIWGRTATLQTL